MEIDNTLAYFRISDDFVIPVLPQPAEMHVNAIE